MEVGWDTDGAASRQANWPALDNVDAFRETLRQAGFSLTPGQFSYCDMTEAACKGWAPQAGNNPWPNVYLSLQLPPHQGVNPPLPDIDRYWQLREEEAIVMAGQTPPGRQLLQLPDLHAHGAGMRGTYK